MAAKAKKPTKGVVTVEKNGISIEINLDYAASWQGLKTVARMQSSELSDGARFLATMEYYDHAVLNADEVAKALGGDDIPASEVLAFLGEAIKEATPKN